MVLSSVFMVFGNNFSNSKKNIGDKKMKLEEIRKIFDNKSLELKEIEEKLKEIETNMKAVDCSEHDIWINKQAYVIALADIHLISLFTAKKILDANNEEYKEKCSNQDRVANLFKMLSDEYANMVDYAGAFFEINASGKIYKDGKEIGELKIKAELYEEFKNGKKKNAK